MYRCCAAIPPLSFLLFSLVSCFASLFHRPPSNLFASRLVPPRTFCRSALGKFCQKHVDIKNSRAEKKKKKEKNKKNKKKKGKNIHRTTVKGSIGRRYSKCKPDRALLKRSARFFPQIVGNHFFRVQLLFKEITAERDRGHAGSIEPPCLSFFRGCSSPFPSLFPVLVVLDGGRWKERMKRVEGVRYERKD